MVLPRTALPTWVAAAAATAATAATAAGHVHFHFKKTGALNLDCWTLVAIPAEAMKTFRMTGESQHECVTDQKK